MKLFGSLLTLATAFGAGFLAHRLLTERDEDCVDPEECVCGSEPENEAECDEFLDLDDVFAPDEEEYDVDPKFYEAVELAIETQKVATSLLQRRLGVGYGRAAKIIDRMEALGYVSAPEGNKARKVLITHAEYASMSEKDGD